MSRLHFDERRLDFASTEELRTRLSEGKPLALVGPRGTGRRTAALRALEDEGVLRVDYGDRVDRVPRLLRQLAAHLDGGGRALRAWRNFGLEAALKELAPVKTRPLLVERAQPLLVDERPTAWAHSAPGMLSKQDLMVREWLLDGNRSTVLVGSRCKIANLGVVNHSPPPGAWPLVLKHAEDGFRDWQTLAHKLLPRLDLFCLAHAAAHLFSADVFNDLVQDAELGEILAEFRQAFRYLDSRKAAALDLVYSLGGAPRPVIESALDVLNEQRNLGPLSGPSGAEMLCSLLDAKLITVTDSGPLAGTTVLPSTAAVEYGFASTLSADKASSVARRLLDSVNDPGGLDPETAGRVLAVHSLAVTAGDVGLASETATLHVHGLIELAQTLSREKEDHLRAWELYDRIEPLVSAERVKRDSTVGRTRSYVLHYRAHNGQRCGRVDISHALEDYSAAVNLWPQNARWQGSLIRTFAALDDRDSALRALNTAREAVAPHPQRARHLNVYPAQDALVKARNADLSLELLGLETQEWSADPMAVEDIRGLFGRLRGGWGVNSLGQGESRLIFHQHQELQLHHDRQRGWAAELNQLGARVRAARPREALNALAEVLGKRLRALLGQPTPWLNEEARRRKGILMAEIDVLQSDIGLAFSDERWFVGRLVDRHLVVRDTRIGGPIAVAENALPQVEHPERGLWFGRAPVDRGGLPTGAVSRLKPAGANRSAEQIREALRELWDEAS